VTVVRTDVSEASITIIKVKRFSELGTTLVRSVLQLLVTSNVPSPLSLFTLVMEAMISPKTSVLTIATWCHIPEDGIL
jgi:hypothetical protein